MRNASLQAFLPERVRIVRPGYPFHGQEVEVRMGLRDSEGRLHLRVELADGGRREIPASWTDLEASDKELPRERLRAQDLLELARLVEFLERRHGGESKRAEAAPAGSAGAGGAPVAEAEPATGSAARAGDRAGTADDRDAAGGERR